MNAKVRLFDYDPTTEIGTQVGEHVCELHNSDGFATGLGPGGGVLQNDSYAFASIAETPGEVVITMWARLYKTSFCKFFIPEAE